MTSLVGAHGTTGSGTVGRGLQSEDAAEAFARSCGSVCNKPPTHTVCSDLQQASRGEAACAPATHDCAPGGAPEPRQPAWALFRDRLPSGSRPAMRRGSRGNRNDGTWVQLSGCCVAGASGADCGRRRALPRRGRRRALPHRGRRRALRSWVSNLGLSALNSMFIVACEVF